MPSTKISTIHASVIVPARNEAAHIQTCLDSLLSQSAPQEDYEVIVVDGNSTDGTASIVSTIQKTRSNLRLVGNPAGSIPIGLNLGIQVAQGDVIIIAGAHSTYPKQFVEKSMEYLEKTGADVVGGPIEVVPLSHGLSARLNSVILSSRFGVGNSRGRTTRRAGFVDSVFYGAYKREVLQRIGYYNERLSRNEDNDLSARVREAGGRIYLTPELTVEYHPTSSFLKLFRKAFNDPKWHFVSVRENPRSMAARHFIPLALLLILFSSAIAALFVPWAYWAVAIILGLHLGVGGCFALARARKLRFAGVLLFPFASLAFHLGYGAGTLMGLLKAPDPPEVRTRARPSAAGGSSE